VLREEAWATRTMRGERETLRVVLRGEADTIILRASSVIRQRIKESGVNRTTRELKASIPISQESKKGKKLREHYEGDKHYP